PFSRPPRPPPAAAGAASCASDKSVDLNRNADPARARTGRRVGASLGSWTARAPKPGRDHGPLRSSTPRQRAGPLSFRARSARDGVLAPPRPGPPADTGGRPAPDPLARRLPRSADAAAASTADLAGQRAPEPLRGRYVPRSGGGCAGRAQARELPRAHENSPPHVFVVPRPPAAAGGVRRRAPQRTERHAARPV